MYRALARRLPDLPRWVEARALLLRGRCELFGLHEAPEVSFVVRDPATELIAVVGSPAVDAVHAAVERTTNRGTLIVALEQARRLGAALPGWTLSHATLHGPGRRLRLPAVPAGTVRFLCADELAGVSVSNELRQELLVGSEHSPVAASFAGGEPVSFCYAGAITESLWDVSIDTLPGYRRRGHAALCVAYMIRRMQARGKRPVWGAADENPASYRLARKLGFVPVDKLALLERSGGNSPQ